MEPAEGRDIILKASALEREYAAGKACEYETCRKGLGGSLDLRQMDLFL